MNLQLMLYGLLNIIVVIAISPLFMGIIKKIKAAFQRRHGPPILQQYYNLAKLFHKESVVSTNSSWITRATPYINITVMIVAALFIPLFFIPQFANGADNAYSWAFGNILLFVYLLALAKFFMALSGLDAASTFGGMGSSREMSISAIVEPIIFLIFFAFAFIFKTTNIFGMVSQSSAANSIIADPVLMLLAVALFIVLITESSRIPVDNPETHLELTMIHEAMILEQSGRNLALMELSNAIKQTLIMALFINIFVPFGFASNLGMIAILIAIAAFIFKGVILAALIGLFESSLPKFRLFKLPLFFMISLFLVFLTIILEVFA